jgi:hypothetical protein
MHVTAYFYFSIKSQIIVSESNSDVSVTGVSEYLSVTGVSEYLSVTGVSEYLSVTGVSEFSRFINGFILSHSDRWFLHNMAMMSNPRL